MSEGIIWKGLEFLLGFFVVPIIVNVLGAFLIILFLPLFNISNESQFIFFSRIIMLGLDAIVFFILLKFRKAIAAGFLLDTLIEVFLGFQLYSLLSLNF